MFIRFQINWTKLEIWFNKKNKKTIELFLMEIEMITLEKWPQTIKNDIHVMMWASNPVTVCWSEQIQSSNKLFSCILLNKLQLVEKKEGLAQRLQLVKRLFELGFELLVLEVYAGARDKWSWLFFVGLGFFNTSLNSYKINFINFRLSLPRPTVWSSFHPILILFWKKVLRIKIIFDLYFCDR